MRYALAPNAPRLAASAVAALALMAALACKDRDASKAGRGDAGGTLIISAPTDVDVLFPPIIASMEGKRATDLLFDHLADIGESMNTIGDEGFQPRLAEKWEWAKDSMSIAFHLDPKARWHDGVPVRAGDVRFTHQVYSDPVVGSQSQSNVANIDSVSVRDSLTAVVWFKHRSPEQFFDAVYHEAIIPEHLLGKTPHAELKSSDFLKHPVGTGRFRFASWTPGATLEFVADTLNYRGRAKLDRVLVTVAPDYNAAITKLYAGEADLFENLRADNIGEIGRHADLVARPRPSIDYGFMGFNLKDHATARPNPLFADRAVRRAITMTLDRATMVRSVMDSLGKVSQGPVTAAIGGAPDARQLPYDTGAAARVLDSLGWRRGPDGMRSRAGRPMAFTLIVPTSSKTRMNFAVLIQEQLKRAGIAVTLDPLEFNTFVQRQAAGDFDATMLSWSIDPSRASGLRQSWGSAGLRARGGNNYGSYVNPAFDAQVDSGATSFDAGEARRHFAAAYQTAVDDAPAVWLYEPRAFYGVHRRIRPAGVRGDAWWAGLADWTVDPAQRLPRDEIGLRPR